MQLVTRHMVLRRAATELKPSGLLMYARGKICVVAVPLRAPRARSSLRSTVWSRAISWRCTSYFPLGQVLPTCLSAASHDVSEHSVFMISVCRGRAVSGSSRELLDDVSLLTEHLGTRVHLAPSGVDEDLVHCRAQTIHWCQAEPEAAPIHFLSRFRSSSCNMRSKMTRSSCQTTSFATMVLCSARTETACQSLLHVDLCRAHVGRVCAVARGVVERHWLAERRVSFMVRVAGSNVRSGSSYRPTTNCTLLVGASLSTAR